MTVDPPERTGDSDDVPTDPEEFAEAAGTDPTPQEIEEYRDRIGDPSPEPVEPPD